VKPSVAGLLLFATLATGQKFELKDRNGVPRITIEDVNMFRYSDYFKESIPVFQGTVKNASSENLFGVSVAGFVRKKDGTVIRFKPYICGTSTSCDTLKTFVHETTYPFGQPWPFRPAEFDSVEFVLESAQRVTTKDGFHASGFVAKDEGCLNDYLGTRSLTGVNLRKKLVDLVEYGCGFFLEHPEAAGVLSGKKKMFGTGAKRVAAVEIIIVGEEILPGQRSGPHVSEYGWIQESALSPGRVLILEQIGVGVRPEK
jgi:hypothetical protein